jgi:hypothetical protein
MSRNALNEGEPTMRPRRRSIKEGSDDGALTLWGLEGRSGELRYSWRNRFANTLASPTMFSMIVYSFG